MFSISHFNLRNGGFLFLSCKRNVDELQFERKSKEKKSQTMSNTLKMYTDPTWLATREQQPLSKELFYVPPPASFIIPIFRAPTTTSTGENALKTTTSKIVTALLRQEGNFNENLSTTTSNMISQRIFENLILTNTIVATFCIILMITLTAFLIFLLIPSIRRRWLSEKEQIEKQNEDIATLSRQQSFQQFTLGPSRLNPLFDSSTANTAAGTTTQFTSLFHPHTTATVLHPTIWTPMTSTSVVSNPIAMQQTQLPPTNPTSIGPKPATTTTTQTTTTNTTGTGGIGRPPLPTHPPTTVQRSPKRR